MTDDKIKVVGTNKYTTERLRELSEQPNTTVYEHVYDTPKTMLPPDVQLELFKTLVFTFDMCTHIFPNATDEYIREHLTGHLPSGVPRIPRARLFQELYPCLFATITQRVKSDESLINLDKARTSVLNGLAEMVYGKGSKEERTARGAMMAARLAMRPATNKELKMAKEGGTLLTAASSDDPAVAKSLNTMKPITPAEVLESGNEGRTLVQQPMFWRK